MSDKDKLIASVEELKKDTDNRLKRLRDGINESKENRRKQTAESNR